MFRGSPFSAGTVRISPRASNSARVRVRRQVRVRSAGADVHHARADLRHVARDGTGTAFACAGLQVEQTPSPPNCSMTIASAPAAADLKSSPLFLTSSFTCFDRVS